MENGTNYCTEISTKQCNLNYENLTRSPYTAHFLTSETPNLKHLWTSKIENL